MFGLGTNEAAVAASSNGRSTSKLRQHFVCYDHPKELVTKLYILLFKMLNKILYLNVFRLFYFLHSHHLFSIGGREPFNSSMHITVYFYPLNFHILMGSLSLQGLQGLGWSIFTKISILYPLSTHRKPTHFKLHGRNKGNK